MLFMHKSIETFQTCYRKVIGRYENLLKNSISQSCEFNYKHSFYY